MTGKILNIKRLEDTSLWQELLLLEDKNTAPLIALLPTICEEASDRMKTMPASSPQYTLHDECHFVRVVELMAMILGESLKHLNSVEICLLILAAYFHDQGMVMSEDEFKELSKSTEFQLFRETWNINHPNKNEIQNQLQDCNINDQERERLSKLLAELEAGMQTDYLRTTHASRSANLVLDTFSSDKRLEVSSVNISFLLAKICESHYSNVENLTPGNGYNYDEQVGSYNINLPFLSIILRLADILDFDSDRTPDVIFKTIHFSSDISLQEWEKHRGVKGWKINKNLIRFTANYSHPAYQASALRFMDWIDKELQGCHSLCRTFPAEFSKYKLYLPLSVDRSRIQPLNNSYIFHNLEIGLSRNEIVKLLMTDKLYNHPSICIRELLQNSLDALRYRKTLFLYHDIEWNQGQVEFLHDTDDDGYEIIQCKDNGSGMDRDIVTRFFTTAGRSFYRSPEFEIERMNFRKKNIDYDPCSQFGIGFMSCFMLGDRIQIKTRRDYGHGKNLGEPLFIEINGLGGLIVIREGSASQEIGTTVTITSRKKPSYMDEWEDNVLLTTALKKFAVATEFPIKGQCNIKEIEDTVEIPITSSYIPTLIERSKMDGECYITIEQNFKELDRNLNGNIRESFLIDEHGMPTLENKFTFWEINKNKANRPVFMFSFNGEMYDTGYSEQSQISIDGIHLCGIAGRPLWQKDSSVKMRLGNRPTNIERNPYSLDVRGNLKPEISPAREPIDHWGFSQPPKWNKLINFIHQAAGLIWMKLLNEFIPRGLTYEIFWKLLRIHNGDLRDIPLCCLWQQLAVPSIKNDQLNWIKISDLKELSLQKNDEDCYFLTSDKQKIKIPASIEEWEKRGREHPNLQSQLNSLIVNFSKLLVKNDNLIFIISYPNNDQVTSNSVAITGPMRYIQTLQYQGAINDFITAKTFAKIANSIHPLVKQCFINQDNTPLSKFASSFVPCVVDIASENNKKRSFLKPDRWMKISAHYYFQVDWSLYEDNLIKPPYKIWLDNEIIEIVESDFVKWREI